jgi:hypothetical protein
MAFVHLKNAGLVDSDNVEFKSTTVKRLVPERVGKDLFRQVHLVRFVKKTGEVVEVITVSESSSQECSMSGISAYVVSKQLGDYAQ